LSTTIGMWPVHAFFLLLAAYLFYRRNYLLPFIPKFVTLFFSLFKPKSKQP
jgi:lipopolysaccharide export system permease protein